MTEEYNLLVSKSLQAQKIKQVVSLYHETERLFTGSTVGIAFSKL